MKWVCVDTSTFTESIALVEGDTLWGERNVRRSYGHASGLHTDLSELLDEAGWSLTCLDGLIIGTGPGSFTGLRVGMAAAKGLAYALNKPLYGIPTSRALLAALADQRGALALIDARRGEVYAEGELLDQARCFTPESSIEMLIQQALIPRVLVGEGALKYRSLFMEVWPDVHIPEASAAHLPRASLLASQLKELSCTSHLSPDAIAALEPIYVRASDAEINYPDGFPSEARLFQ